MGIPLEWKPYHFRAIWRCEEIILGIKELITCLQIAHYTPDEYASKVLMLATAEKEIVDEFIHLSSDEFTLFLEIKHVNTRNEALRRFSRGHYYVEGMIDSLNAVNIAMMKDLQNRLNGHLPQ